MSTVTLTGMAGPPPRSRYCSAEGCPHRPAAAQRDGFCKKHSTAQGRLNARLAKPITLPAPPKQRRKRRGHWKRPPDAPASPATEDP